MQLSEIKINPNNPQKFNDLSKLEKSVSEFPKMFKYRPIVLDKNNMVLGGNKRVICLQNLRFKEIPDEWVKYAEDLTKEEQERFIIADNVGFGEWDWEILTNEWDVNDLIDWGLDFISYDGLDNEDIEEINDFNEFVNFQIVCNNLKQFEELQTKLNTSAKKLNYDDFLIKVGL